MRFHVHILTGLIVLLLAGCSDERYGEGTPTNNVMHQVQVEFRLGQADLAVSDWTRGGTAERTFVPDGVLVSQSMPPRNIQSSNNWQQINDVRIYLFRENTAGNFVYYKPYDDNGTKRDYLSVEDFSLKFEQSPYVIWWGGDDDVNEMHSYTGWLNLPSGAYRFLALARDDRWAASARRLMDPNLSVATWGWTAWTEGTTRLETATLACARNAELAATELFSGYTTEPILVDVTSNHFSRTLLLNRAVSGILLYMENIPAAMPVRSCDSRDESASRLVPVKSLAVVHGKTLSDQVLIARREAVAGRLAVTPTSPAATYAAPTGDSDADEVPTLPMPGYVLLRIDIPARAQVQNGVYTNLSPGNAAHPNALLKGAFVMPQQANVPGSTGGSMTESYDKTLYLVFLGYDSARQREIALEWRPIRLTGTGTEVYDPLYYPLQANHFYSIGDRRFTIQEGLPVLETDLPIDLQDETSAVLNIQLEPSWNEYYGGEIGNPASGVTLDPVWGELSGGELCE